MKTRRKCPPGCPCRRHQVTADHAAKISAAKQGHPAYPGSGRPRRPDAEATYTAVHKRLRKERGTPSLCEHCGTTTARKFEWAYTGTDRGTGRFAFSTDLSQYIRLCTPCHYRFDQGREVMADAS